MLKLFKFFPSIDPYGGRRLRAHETANVLGNVFTDYYNTYVKVLNQSFNDYFTTNVWVAPVFLDVATGQNFTSWAEYFGPHEDRLDYFTTIVSAPPLLYVSRVDNFPSNATTFRAYRLIWKTPMRLYTATPIELPTNLNRMRPRMLS